MAASSSSASPARRAPGQLGPTPFSQPGQRTFAYPYPVASPHHQGSTGQQYPFAPPSGSSLSTPSAPHGHHLRNRVSGSYPTPKGSAGATPTGHLGGILPTPDPTIASCISDEDVAIQLMRLGDTSNLSHETRNSTSTLDDGLSGVADAASSNGAASESEDESDGTEQPTLPVAPARAHIESSPIPIPGSIKRRHKHLDEILPSFDSTEPSGDESGRIMGLHFDPTEDRKDATFTPVADTKRKDHFKDEVERVVKPKTKSETKPRSHHAKSKSNAPKKHKIKASAPAPAPAIGGLPISPASMSNASRKISGASTMTFQHPLGEDEEDLSSKPRCQRCRKSKKGCDRQRPCQRCKDAGIGVDGCVSEDEGNGRKGRFGRHMGVVVKKDSKEVIAQEMPVVDAASGAAVVAAGSSVQDKSKKRKR